MTEEELIEEYAEGLCKTCTVHTCRHNILKTCAIKESIKQAFLAGLQAQTQWHKVADEDLPKENEYIMIYSKLADNIAIGKRRCAGKIHKRCVYEWYFATYEGTYCLKNKDVIAWKEIVFPKESE